MRELSQYVYVAAAPCLLLHPAATPQIEVFQVKQVMTAALGFSALCCRTLKVSNQVPAKGLVYQTVSKVWCCHSVWMQWGCLDPRPFFFVGAEASFQILGSFQRSGLWYIMMIMGSVQVRNGRSGILNCLDRKN